MRAALCFLAALGCRIEPPEPTLAQRACQYYDACEPAFALAFPGIDSCIDTLQSSRRGLDVCEAGAEAVEACTSQLATSIDTCSPITEGACGELTSCAGVVCRQTLVSLSESCSQQGIDIDIEALLGVCSLAVDSGCVAECLVTSGCNFLAEVPEIMVSTCLSDCGAL